MKNQQYAVKTSVIIHTPRAKVWALLTQFDDVYTWAPGVLKSHGIGKQELGVGHGRHCELQGFGGVDELITQWQPGSALEYSVSSVGPLRDGSSLWQLSDAGNNQTRLDIQLSYNLGFGIIGKIMHAVMMQKKLQGSLKLTGLGVKTKVESEQSEQASTAVLQAG